MKTHLINPLRTPQRAGLPDRDWSLMPQTRRPEARDAYSATCQSRAGGSAAVIMWGLGTRVRKPDCQAHLDRCRIVRRSHLHTRTLANTGDGSYDWRAAPGLGVNETTFVINPQRCRRIPRYRGHHHTRSRQVTTASMSMRSLPMSSDLSRPIAFEVRVVSGLEEMEPR